MQLIGIGDIVFFCFGAAMVGFYSWSRFDEPSCDSQSEYFARFKPRFSTSYTFYRRAKLGYVCAIVLLYGILSFVPELFVVLAGAGPNVIPKNVSPLVVALAIVSLQNAPVLRDLECRIRGFLHAFARIPECVRRTVARMRSSPFNFNFNANAVAAQTRKLNLRETSNMQLRAALTNLLNDDDLLHGWYSVGCVLCGLSDRNRDNTGIDSLFFELYQDELDSITARHVALAELVREHVTDCLKSKAAGSSGRKADAGEPAALREVRDLRERLYTLVACGVHSSIKHDGEGLELIGRLGFAVTPSDREHRSIVLPLIGLSVIALFVLSIVSSVWTRGFSESLKEQVGPDWIGAFGMIPTSMPGYITWSWQAAAFYFSAVFVALAIRNARIVQREWFDLDNLHRERPILRYIVPTLAGMAVGCFTLILIAVAGAPGFKASFSVLGKAIVQTLPWFPLAMVLPLIAIVLSDTPFESRGFWRTALVRAMYGAIIMALVGILTSGLSISNSVDAFAQEHHMEIPASVTEVRLYVSLFITSQIAVLVFVLCFVIQVADRYTSRTPRLAGQHVDIVTRQGPEFSILFDNAGEASLLAPKGKDIEAAPILCRGQWQMFAEGTAVRWNAEEGSPKAAGSFGLISSCGDSMIYEGYVEQFSAKADFFAQVRLRNNVRRDAVRIAPKVPPAVAATIVPPDCPEPLVPRKQSKPAIETV
jgi:hypothetical protein